MNFYFKSCILSVFLGLTTVMLIYGLGIGSADSKVCREQYSYSVERFGSSCRLVGFPTSYVENDVWGHNAHVYPWEFTINVLMWAVVWCLLLSLIRGRLRTIYNAVSTTNEATRSAIVIESLAAPLIFLILVNDLPIRQADVIDIFFSTVNRWSVLYVPIPMITLIGFLVGIVGLFHNKDVGQGDASIAEGSRQSRILRTVVLYLPFLIAMWNVMAMMFVGWIPEVV